MTDHPPCAVDNCETPTPDQLCKRHRSDLRNALQQLPGLLAELEVTTTRQAVTSRGSGGASTKASEEPIPFDVDASEMDWVVRNTVTTWARVVVEEHYGRLPTLVPGPVCAACFHPSCAETRTRLELHRRATPPTRFAALCGWLAHHLPWIVQQPWAAQMHDEITSIRPFANRTVDNREDRYAGPCTHAVLVAVDVAAAVVGFAERVCGAPLRLRNNAHTVRCKLCDAEYETVELWQRIVDRSRDELATGPDISALLTDALGIRISWATIRKMAFTGAIIHVTTDDNDRKLYRIGDVLAVLEARELSAQENRMSG